MLEALSSWTTRVLDQQAKLLGFLLLLKSGKGIPGQREKVLVKANKLYEHERDLVLQRLRLVGEVLRGGREFLGLRRVALGDAVHLLDRPVHLLDALRLLTRRGADLARERRHRPHVADDVLERLAGPVHEHGPLPAPHTERP